MSSEIFYKKAFIKVGNGIIPLANHGSSNCSDFNLQGREVAEKHWSVLNYPHSDKLIFTVDEMKEQAEVYEHANTSNRGGTKKSRYRSFEVEEFGRWILAGVKNAKTVEEYVSYGNSFYFYVYSESQKIPFSTTEQLLGLIKKYEGYKDLNVSFIDSRDFIPKPCKNRRKRRIFR